MTIGCGEGSDTHIKVYYQPFSSQLLVCANTDTNPHCGTCSDSFGRCTSSQHTWCSNNKCSGLPWTSFNDFCAPQDILSNPIAHCPDLGALQATSAERIGDYGMDGAAPQCGDFQDRESAALLNCCYDLEQTMDAESRRKTIMEIGTMQTVATKDLDKTSDKSPLITVEDMDKAQNFYRCGLEGQQCCEGNACFGTPSQRLMCA